MLLPHLVAALVDDDRVAGAGEEIGGGDHPVGVEPFAAGGVVGEGTGVKNLVQGGVFKGDAANDDVQVDPVQCSVFSVQWPRRQRLECARQAVFRATPLSRPIRSPRPR